MAIAALAALLVAGGAGAVLPEALASPKPPPPPRAVNVVAGDGIARVDVSPAKLTADETYQVAEPDRTWQPLPGDRIVRGLSDDTAQKISLRTCKGSRCSRPVDSPSFTPRPVESPTLTPRTAGGFVDWNSSAAANVYQLDGITQPDEGTGISETFGYGQTHTLTAEAVNAFGQESSPATSTVYVPVPKLTLSQAAGQATDCQGHTPCVLINLAAANLTPLDPVKIDAYFSPANQHFAYTGDVDVNGNLTPITVGTQYGAFGPGSGSWVAKIGAYQSPPLTPQG